MRNFTFVVVLLLSNLISIAQHTYVRVLSKKNFTPKTDSMLNAALPLIDSVINTDAFRAGILQAKFINNKEMSNDSILNLILRGREVYLGIANDTIDLNLETYPDQKGDNIGTTYNSRKIVTSRAYILRNNARCYAAHLIHEYCHTIGYKTTGFSHRHRVITKKHRREKCQSVPYIVGDLARQILGVRTCKCECENFPQL